MADPRKDDDFETVNQFLRDQSIRHRLGLERTAGSIRNDVIGLLNESDEEIEQRLQHRLQRGLSEGAARPQQLQSLRSEIQTINNRVMDDVDGELKDQLRNLSTDESRMARERLQKAIPVEIKPNAPAPNTLKSLVATNPMEGKTLSQWTDTVKRDRTDKIMNEVRKGIVEGDSNQDIVNRVIGTRNFGYKDGILEQSRNNVAAITRTSVTNVTSTAREMTYKQNRSVIKGVQYVATLDERTTIRCATLDGKVFDIGEGPRPEQHFGCRSTTAPQTKSWREMGIDRSDIDPSSRASMNGQVPETKTFKDFMKDPNGPDPKDILGATRAKLWQEGNLDLEDFLKGGIKQHTEIWTVEELKRRHAEILSE